MLPETTGAQGLVPAPVVEIFPEPVRDPAGYTTYIPTACKAGQFFQYTCEFDAAWALIKTYGIDAPFEEQLEAIGHDTSIEPQYVQSGAEILVNGGDIASAFSGDYTHNFLARARCSAMRDVFRHFELGTRRVRNRAGVEGALDDGLLVFIKMTVDFLDWTPATWVTPAGKRYPVALTNDHAAIVMGYSPDVVVIRDVLGPTDTNWGRPYEYEIGWENFLRCWAAQGSDGVAAGIKSSSSA